MHADVLFLKIVRSPPCTILIKNYPLVFFTFLYCSILDSCTSDDISFGDIGNLEIGEGTKLYFRPRTDKFCAGSPE